MRFLSPQTQGKVFAYGYMYRTVLYLGEEVTERRACLNEQWWLEKGHPNIFWRK